MSFKTISSQPNTKNSLEKIKFISITLVVFTMHLSLSIKNHFLESDLNRKINKTRRRSVVPSTEPISDDETILHKYLLFSFLIISFGYMLPW